MGRKVRAAMIGTGSRQTYMYAPILRGLTDDIEVVSVWGRSKGSVDKTAAVFGVPGYTDLGTLIDETGPEIGIVCVNSDANGQVALMAVEHGLSILTETPIAHDLDEADAIIRTAESKGLKVEVSEQFHRRPLEQLKLKLIETGIFGKVHTSYSDFAGHGYHGMSVMRSYLGFDKKPIRVVGAMARFPMDPHLNGSSGAIEERTESTEHAIVWFEDGGMGIFHWTGVGYDSGLRWWRSSRFMAERGMGVTVGTFLDVEERLSYLASGSEGPQFITVERVLERCDGGALKCLKAHTGSAAHPVVRWDNPFYREPSGSTPQWHDDEIGVAGCIMSLVDAVRENTAPTYGAVQARLDQELVVLMRKSAEAGGTPVEMP